MVTHATQLTLLPAFPRGLLYKIPDVMGQATAIVILARCKMHKGNQRFTCRHMNTSSDDKNNPFSFTGSEIEAKS